MKFWDSILVIADAVVFWELSPFRTMQADVETASKDNASSCRQHGHRAAVPVQIEKLRIFRGIF